MLPVRFVGSLLFASTIARIWKGDLEIEQVGGWLSSSLSVLNSRPGVVTLMAMALVPAIGRKIERMRRKELFAPCPEVADKFKVVGKMSPLSLTLDDVPLLVSEMRQAFASGHTRAMSKRLAELQKLNQFVKDNEEELLQVMKEDLGRPRCEGWAYDILLVRKEIEMLIAYLEDWSADESMGFNLLTFPSQQCLVHEPYGTALVIGTWNFPVMLTLVPLAGAIAAGNNVVLKPCNVAPATAKFLGTVLPKYLDPLVCSIVGPSMAGDRACTGELMKHHFDHVFFTGSPSVGKVIHEKAAKYLTPTCMELGGKNPVYVDRNCDIKTAALRICWGAILNAGQQCVRPDYCLVHKDVVEQFCEATKAAMQRLYADDPNNVGRIVGDRQMARLVGLLKSHGGSVVCGGRFDSREKFIEPTVVRVGFDSPMMQEETFGPILLVAAVDSAEAALNYIAEGEKALSLYVFSSSAEVQEKVIRRTSSGGVTVNGCLWHAGHGDLPFGGVGESGHGAYHGRATFNTFSHKKPVLRKALPSMLDVLQLADPFFIYQPWTSFKEKVFLFLFNADRFIDCKLRRLF